MFDLPLGLPLRICDLMVLACICVLFKLIFIEAFLKKSSDALRSIPNLISVQINVVLKFFLKVFYFLSVIHSTQDKIQKIQKII